MNNHELNCLKFITVKIIRIIEKRECSFSAKTKLKWSISLINTIRKYAAADNNVGEDDFSEDINID